VAFRETVERLARNEFLGDLPFEFDAMLAELANRTIVRPLPFPLRGRTRHPCAENLEVPGRVPPGI
jgi:hypothetical protein